MPKLWPQWRQLHDMLMSDEPKDSALILPSRLTVDNQT